MRTYFVESFEGDTFCMSGDEHHHLANVLRTKCGEMVVLCCGDGYERIGKITRIEKNFTTIEIVERRLSNRENDIEITLYQSLSKADRMELICQKMTELGVNRIVPFISNFCAVKRESLKPTRMNKIILEASKQCKRARLTELSEPMSFEQMIAHSKGNDLVVFANERDDKKALRDILENAKNSIKNIKKIGIIIGCEGGFSEDECKSIQQSGAHSTGLGERILRLETASIVVASIILNYFGQI